MTLEEFCKDFDCPHDWTAAVALAEACDSDAGDLSCWSVESSCGDHVLSRVVGPDPLFLLFDRTTGKLIGAAVQTTDAASPCVVSEIIAGENRSHCGMCEDDAGH